MTYKEDPYKKGFGPFAPEVYTLPYPNNENELNFDNTDFDPKNIACVVIEPVLGEGGFIPASKTKMTELKKYCLENQILFISDEVQTGFGRTGSLFAIEQFGVEPDMITIAKSIAGGLPLSGVIGKSEIIDSVHIGGIGGTYSGNPVSCEAALAVLEIMEEEQLLKNANIIGQTLRSRINSIIPKCPWIKEIRGMGAMIGIEIINDKTGDPDKERTNKIHQEALKNGLIMITAGTFGNVIRTLMPLTIDKDTLHEGIDILVNAIKNH
jgi:4-aminobutyrate aminotransferase-like enzyme